MKLSKIVKECIVKHPELFLSETFEKSILKVYNYLFSCLGIDYRIANTENIEDGGYLIDFDGYTPKKDKPYSSFEDDFLTEESFEKVKKSYLKNNSVYEELYKKLNGDYSINLGNVFEDFEENFEENILYSSKFLQSDYKKALNYYWNKVKEHFSNNLKIQQKIDKLINKIEKI